MLAVGIVSTGALTFVPAGSALADPVPVSFAAPVSAPSVVFGDFNGDGDEDFVGKVDYPLWNNIAVTLSDGHGGYGAPVNYLAGTEIPDLPPSVPGVPGSIVGVIKVADVNNDDQPDLVVANANGPGQEDASVSVLLGAPGGTFGPPTTYFPVGGSLFSLAVGDLNHDGLPDIVAADGEGSGFYVLLGTGGGAFAPAILYLTAASQGSIAVADFNGDSWPDVVTSEADLTGTGTGTLRLTYVFLNDQHGGFDQGTIIEDEVGQVVVADLNGDARPDIVINEDFQIVIVLNAPDGSYPRSRIQSEVPGSDFARGMVVADFNGDADPDLAFSVANTSFVRVQLGNGDGTFATGTDFPGGTDPRRLAVGDLNNDAKPDIFVENTGVGVSVLFNTTSSADTTNPTMTCSANPSKLKPTGKLASVSTTVTVTDETGGSGSAGFTLLSVHSNQADSGLAHNDRAGDIQGWTSGVADTSGQLRTERFGINRVYTLTYQGADLAGNTTNCQTTVTIAKAK